MAGLELFANQAQTTVSSGGTTAPAAGTSQTWTMSSSLGFPAASSTAATPTFFRITDPAAPSEKMIVTNVSGTTWTVTRGAEGTTPVTHASGFTVQNVITAAALEALVQMASAGFVLPSGDATGVTDAAAINAAIAALPAQGGAVRLAAGIFYVTCGSISVNRSGVYIDGAGKWATLVSAVGAGDAFRMYDSSNYEARTVSGGGVRGMAIDGTSTTGNSTGIHFGDIFQSQWDVAVSNFTAGTTSVGFKADNQWAISEQMQGLIFATNCTTHVMFAQTPQSGNSFCYGSFERANLNIFVNQVGPDFDGITLANGTYMDNSVLTVGGNFGGSASALTSAVFKLTGATPSGSQDGSAGAVPSNMNNMTFNVGVECVGGLAHAPTTFSVDSGSGCFAGNLFGSLHFGAAGNTFTATSAIISFFGTTDGDPAIVAQTSQSWLYQGPFAVGTYASAASLASSGTIAVSASWAVVGPTAAVTGVILGAGAWDGQFLTVYNNSAFSVTFAVAGTSRVASGTAEVITPASMRMYQWSADASLWYPVSSPTDAVRPAEQFVALSATYTLASGTTLQKLFNATSTGALTVQAATSYFFECQFDLSSMASTTATSSVSFGFGGTATLTSVKYTALSQKSASLTTPATPSLVEGAAAAAQVLVSSTTTGMTTGTCRIRGIVRVNAAGTLIPEVALSTSTTTAVVGTNSYFRIWPAGSNTVTSVGPWA